MLETISENQRPDWIDIHNLKMIKYGSGFFIDCDLTLPWYYNIEQGHEACEALRRAIEKGFSDRITLSLYTRTPAKRSIANTAGWQTAPTGDNRLRLLWSTRSMN